MKIVSWNVNGIRACYKKGLSEFIEAVEPDVLCLQETKAHVDQVDDATKSLGYEHHYWSSAVKKGYSGVATFCNQEPLAMEKGIGIHEYDSEGRIVITTFKSFDLYNIYFPNGGSGDTRHLFKQKFLKDLNAHLKKQLGKGKSIVVVGDYNVAHQEVDVFDPIRLSKVSGFLPEEREWFSQFLDLGFIDTFRHLNPEAKDKYTWWSYRELAKIGNRGWRIDYVCISKDLKKFLKKVEIMDAVEGSDHCPVSVELDL